MADRGPLERLWPEIQQQIFIQLGSFNSLHALIAASPRMYQVFRLNKKMIMSTVTRRQFDSTAIQAALAIEKLYQIQDPPFSEDTVLTFFDVDLRELEDTHNSILPLPVSIKLGKLDGVVRFFTEDYAQNTLPILVQLKESKKPIIKTEYKRNCHFPKSELSRSETNRLRRAFCRFETYRQLFSRFSSDFNDDVRQCCYEKPLTAYRQAELFFQNKPAYQAAEIACIRDYLHRRLRGVFDQVEDEIVQEVQAGCPNPKNKNEGLDWDWNNGGRHQYLEDDMDYFGYSGQYMQSYHIEYLLMLGLPYVRRILESTGDERRNLLRCSESGCLGYIQKDFITAALGLDPLTGNNEQYGWFDRNVDSCLDENSKADLPRGWLWAHTKDYYHGLVDVDAKGLRDWGYVFWDAERLHNAGVLDLE